MAFVTLFAASVQGAAGFGFGLMALPAYLWIMRSTDAVPLVMILNLTICVVLVVRVRASVHRALLARLGGGALMGLPRLGGPFSACSS